MATHTALLPFPQIPLASRKCDVFPVLQQPLLSLGQFCDAGFTATLNSETVLLTKDGSTTLSGVSIGAHKGNTKLSLVEL